MLVCGEDPPAEIAAVEEVIASSLPSQHSANCYPPGERPEEGGEGAPPRSISWAGDGTAALSKALPRISWLLQALKVTVETFKFGDVRHGPGETGTEGWEPLAGRIPWASPPAGASFAWAGGERLLLGYLPASSALYTPVPPA